MNDQTGTARLPGNAINIASSPVVPPRARTIGHASPLSEAFRDFDRTTAAALARVTGGLSPIALWLAYFD
ncbi:poly-beta-hydroxybutyrate polymerase N-terminal domain-containing protein [Methylovirgula sp. 4M-Z18]|uniref:poly-beta-hydroxybutyrate polymerase N-terminal domain-containing protein n=1 Tax=Methylovirgula sp. 4M-Z18 TaxID=2293567 RepID=UPI000E2E6E84|nr:poly-beta-hydroxybutyrate polymerase N-terminal domain-containing protein [Methylovirgula sp. 4M-Z18]RFB76464.1 hypothetical protein DYH55_20195 [Methylovirgula sp. 4M-Z18]